jgi:hypothetical protein
MTAFEVTLAADPSLQLTRQFLLLDCRRHSVGGQSQIECLRPFRFHNPRFGVK